MTTSNRTPAAGDAPRTATALDEATPASVRSRVVAFLFDFLVVGALARLLAGRATASTAGRALLGGFVAAVGGAVDHVLLEGAVAGPSARPPSASPSSAGTGRHRPTERR